MFKKLMAITNLWAPNDQIFPISVSQAQLIIFYCNLCCIEYKPPTPINLSPHVYHIALSTITRQTTTHSKRPQHVTYE